MTAYRNKQFTKRHPDVTNVVACVASANPNPELWEKAADSITAGLDHLRTQNGVRFYGYL